jgi:hypothetical protein
MTGKYLLTLSLLTFTLTSNAVYADPVADRKRHFSHELRASSLMDNLVLNRVPSDPRLALQSGTYYGSGGNYNSATGDRCAYQYQGGPKSNLRTCSR